MPVQPITVKTAVAARVTTRPLAVTVLVSSRVTVVDSSTTIGRAV